MVRAENHFYLPKEKKNDRYVILHLDGSTKFMKMKFSCKLMLTWIAGKVNLDLNSCL